MSIATLEPVSLEELAEHLRDQTWLDMRVVEYGFLKRVRVFEIRVRLNEEHVAAEQEFVRGTEVHRMEHIFGQDAVRWARPTEFGIEDVKPPSEDHPTQARQRDAKRTAFEDDPLNNPVPGQAAYAVKQCREIQARKPDIWLLRNIALTVLAREYKVPIADILTLSVPPATTARKWCIRMVWELTDLAQYDIPELFGYSSGGMSSHALFDTAQDAQDASKAMGLLREIETSFGGKWKHRRSTVGARSKQKRLL